MIDFTIERLSNGEYFENIELPIEEKGTTIARLIPEDEVLKVLEDKSTQSEDIQLTRDQNEGENQKISDEMFQISEISQEDLQKNQWIAILTEILRLLVLIL